MVIHCWSVRKGSGVCYYTDIRHHHSLSFKFITRATLYCWADITCQIAEGVTSTNMSYKSKVIPTFLKGIISNPPATHVLYYLITIALLLLPSTDNLIHEVFCIWRLTSVSQLVSTVLQSYIYIYFFICSSSKAEHALVSVGALRSLLDALFWYCPSVRTLYLAKWLW